MTQSKHKCSRCGAEMCEDEFCTGDICLDCARVDESTNVNDVKNGIKKFEARKNDRKYNKSDLIEFWKWDEKNNMWIESKHIRGKGDAK